MNRTNEIADNYKQIQNKICEILEKADGTGKFSSNKWQKEIGSGITSVMENGKHIEKVGVNFSHVSGPFTEGMKSILGEDAKTYSATGISSIIHAKSPFVPTIHMNIRYFSLDNGVQWFGGGIDLTPSYIDKNEACTFHQKLKSICDQTSPTFYSEFKPWADDYFFIKHRNETRGIGGIFFDRLKPSKALSFEDLYQFTLSLADAYPNIYSDILDDKRNIPYNEANKKWQLLRRGRYVEFNLVYDRGTKFGLETGGNTESILVSLPSEVNWDYNYTPIPGSPEEITQQLLIKGIDWIN